MPPRKGRERSTLLRIRASARGSFHARTRCRSMGSRRTAREPRGGLNKGCRFCHTSAKLHHRCAIPDPIPLELANDSRALMNKRTDGRPGHGGSGSDLGSDRVTRSEEHTSELQSLAYLVCRLLLEKKKE